MVNSISVAVGGFRLHAIEAGKGPTVLLLHGFGVSSEEWRPSVEFLAANGYRAIAVDALGFGQSDKPADGPYSLELSANLYAELLDQLEIKRAAVVGHSMGGKFALAMALLHPKRVARLLIADSDGFMDIPLFMRKGGSLPWLGEAVLRLTSTRTVIKAQLRAAFHDPDTFVTPELIEHGLTIMNNPENRRALLAFSRHYENNDLGLTGLRARLGELRIPTVIVWGEQDRVFPVKCGFTARDEIPGAHLVVVPRCGHFPQIEAYRAFHGLLLGYLADGLRQK